MINISFFIWLGFIIPKINTFVNHFKFTLTNRFTYVIFVAVLSHNFIGENLPPYKSYSQVKEGILSMPKRTDIEKILIIGSGPIVIGQACEFDYSGTQACKVLRKEGYKIILVNSNPATIMTDPAIADRTYVEPLTDEVLEQIIEEERPDALLPTLGGQTALNLAVALAQSGVLDKYKVKMIGAQLEAIRKAEDRQLFKRSMERAGVDIPRSGVANTMPEAREIAHQIEFPVIIRPAYTLGGTGGSIAYNVAEFEYLAAIGLNISPISEILIEKSVIGWKEFELEVMRDNADNVVVICSIENVDPMGVHTGDSITVAPAQTLTDKEYQWMRDIAIKVIREIGVDTGGSNIQFAVNPKTGRMVVIEMNPRVSRSSALASKATGFPIAKIAAQLAVGYTLDEIQNEITYETLACFEPALDYVVVKIPRWDMEKFDEETQDAPLGIQMKSVGEVMAIGRTFKEALQKGLYSMERGWSGLTSEQVDDYDLEANLRNPNHKRLFYIKEALKKGMPIDVIYDYTDIDEFFLYNLKEIVDMESQITEEINISGNLSANTLRNAKRMGFSDIQLAKMCNIDETGFRALRIEYGIEATFKTVDTCAAEFESYTPYYYSTYERENEAIPSDRKKVIILGSGPNRIGQGIEFDYCCVHAAYGLKEDGYETIMINSNPETVSTDYDTSDRLYFEPLTLEHVLNVIEKESANGELMGVIVQLGGQTPLKLAKAIKDAGYPILGTAPEDIERAENREDFKAVLEKLNLKQARSYQIDREQIKGNISADNPLISEAYYPILVRPSFVLGGRAMKIIYNSNEFIEHLKELEREGIHENRVYPMLVDEFLENAIEIDVDALVDREGAIVSGGIMEHIEEAGVHSGDSACVLPPYTLIDEQIERIRQATEVLGRELNVVGLMNIQYAIKQDQLYVLEVNPRASRTVPFVSKAIGVPLAQLAARIAAGKTLEEVGFTSNRNLEDVVYAIKVPIFPFNKFTKEDPILRPEMRSTGEVMGIDSNFSKAFLKAKLAEGVNLPIEGTAFISVNNKDKRQIVMPAILLNNMGFRILATRGTAKVLRRHDIDVTPVYSMRTGSHPNIRDYIKNGEIDLIINTPTHGEDYKDEENIRIMALRHNIPCVTTIPGAIAAVNGIAAFRRREKNGEDNNLSVVCLQELYQSMRERREVEKRF